MAIHIAAQNESGPAVPIVGFAPPDFAETGCAVKRRSAWVCFGNFQEHGLGIHRRRPVQRPGEYPAAEPLAAQGGKYAERQDFGFARKTAGEYEGRRRFAAEHAGEGSGQGQEAQEGLAIPGFTAFLARKTGFVKPGQQIGRFHANGIDLARTRAGRRSRGLCLLAHVVTLRRIRPPAVPGRVTSAPRR